MTVVLSMHDLWLTALYAHRVIAMSDGRIVGSGPTDEVLTVDLIRDVFGVEVALSAHPLAEGRSIALPYARRSDALPDEAEQALRALKEDRAHPEPTPKDAESPHST